MNKLITTLFMCFMIFNTQAQTNVNSYNLNDSVWEKSNSPYNITGQITIPAGKTLKIEPGVKVIFKGNYSITVNGYIECKGTATNKIEFSGDFLAPDINVLWGGLIVNSPNKSNNFYYFNMEYCVFLNGRGLIIDNNNNSTIVSIISYCEFYKNDFCYNSNALIDSLKYCVFENNNKVFKSQGTGLSLYNNKVINNKLFSVSIVFFNDIINCIIENNGLGRFGGGNLINTKFINFKPQNIPYDFISIGSAKNCLFENNSYLNSYELMIGGELSNSVVKGLRKGAVTNASAGSPTKIEKNTFIGNLFGVVLGSVNSNSNNVTCNKFINNNIALTFSENQMDYVKNNTFCDNEIDAVNISSQSQNLTQNYFCSSDIESKIVDKNDSSKVGFINYNIYNSTQQILTKVIAKDKSILIEGDTTLPIDTSCLSKVNYLFIDLNTPDTICHKLGTPYTSVNPTILSSFNVNQINLVKTYSNNGPVNANVRARYEEIFTATAPNGEKVQKVRVINVDNECISSLKIILNTPDTVCHKVNTPYYSVNPSVQSDVFPSSQISLSRINSNVNPNNLGMYQETFKAIDPSNNAVFKTRYVIVKEECDSNQTTISKITSKNNIIKLFPNPVNSILTIEVLNDFETSFKLIDAQGKQVWSSNVSAKTTRTIDVQNLSNGIYFLIGTNDNNIISEKILIQH